VVVLQAGFRFHHAEPDYLMLVNWIHNTPDTLPANASHRVAIGAFVMNANREVINQPFSSKLHQPVYSSVIIFLTIFSIIMQIFTCNYQNINMIV